MKFALISDIHANLEALQATLGSIETQAVDRIVCLGDVVGYNADPAACVDLIREAGALFVGGSHEQAVAGVITTEEFSEDAAWAAAWTRQQLNDDTLAYLAALPVDACIDNQLIAVHGALLPEGGCAMTRLNSEESRRISFEALAKHPSGARICAFGHTHDLGVYEFREGAERLLAGDEIRLRDDAYYLVNPGTVGQPRGTRDRRATYFVLDTERQAISVHRVVYDYARPIAKSKEAGLVPFHATFPKPLKSFLKGTARAVGVAELAKRMTSARQRRRREAATSRPHKH